MADHERGSIELDEDAKQLRNMGYKQVCISSVKFKPEVLHVC